MLHIVIVTEIYCYINKQEYHCIRLFHVWYTKLIFSMYIAGYTLLNILIHWEKSFVVSLWPNLYSNIVQDYCHLRITTKVQYHNIYIICQQILLGHCGLEVFSGCIHVKSSQCFWALLVYKKMLSIDFKLGHKDGSNGNTWEFTFEAKYAHELDH